MQKYSVLMSVYAKEKPEYLRMSMQSIFDQTIPPNDFVLICDGPLTDALDAVIADMQIQYEQQLNVIRLDKNQGLGYALRYGIKQCKNDLVARMDSDDISRLDRCERELAIFEEDPSISIVGSVIAEFSDSIDNIESLRIVPEKHAEILKFAKMRSPFNHPSVMYRKSAVLAAGNYPEVRYMQDYYLWIEMLIDGVKGYNIQEPLVWMRADNNLFKRRSGKLYKDIQLNLLKYMKNQGFITTRQYMTSFLLRMASSMAPNWMRKFLYRKILRKV